MAICQYNYVYLCLPISTEKWGQIYFSLKNKSDPISLDPISRPHFS